MENRHPLLFVAAGTHWTHSWLKPEVGTLEKSVSTAVSGSPRSPGPPSRARSKKAEGYCEGCHLLHGLDAARRPWRKVEKGLYFERFWRFENWIAIKPWLHSGTRRLYDFTSEHRQGEGSGPMFPENWGFLIRGRIDIPMPCFFSPRHSVCFWNLKVQLPSSLSHFSLLPLLGQKKVWKTNTAARQLL